MRSLRPLLSLVCIVAAPAVTAATTPVKYTDDFPIEDCTFDPNGGNAFFRLMPGLQLYLTNQQCHAAGKCEELEELWITVLDEYRKIDIDDDGRKVRVTTRVVEEMEMADGELVEISRNYFSTCKPFRDVYYFGEDVDIYEGGNVVSHDGAWLAGRNRAEPGIIMPESAFIVGSRYFQEMAPGVALDRAEHVAFDLDVQTPAGKFEDCIKVRETSPIEPGHASIKFYCPGVGLVADGDLKLAAVYKPALSAKEEN